jgi:hypothetical protein
MLRVIGCAQSRRMGALQMVGICLLRPSSARFFVTSFAAIEERSPCENEPAENGHTGQNRRDWVTKQNGGPDGTPEGSEIRRDVVDGGDESLVHDVGDSYEDTTSKGRRQEKTDHGRSLAETPSTIRHFRWVSPLITYPQSAEPVALPGDGAILGHPGR